MPCIRAIRPCFIMITGRYLSEGATFIYNVQLVHVFFYSCCRLLSRYIILSKTELRCLFFVPRPVLFYNLICIQTSMRTNQRKAENPAEKDYGFLMEVEMRSANLWLIIIKPNHKKWNKIITKPNWSVLHFSFMVCFFLCLSDELKFNFRNCTRFRHSFHFWFCFTRDRCIKLSLHRKITVQFFFVMECTKLSKSFQNDQDLDFLWYNILNPFHNFEWVFCH